MNFPFIAKLFLPYYFSKSSLRDKMVIFVKGDGQSVTCCFQFTKSGTCTQVGTLHSLKDGTLITWDFNYCLWKYRATLCPDVRSVSETELNTRGQCKGLEKQCGVTRVEV